MSMILYNGITTILVLIKNDYLSYYCSKVAKDNAQSHLLIDMSADSNCISYEQIMTRCHGYQKGKSMETAIESLTKSIVQALGNKMVVSGAFRDPSKAFDTVDHTVLVQKLENTVIRGHAANWIISYISNRRQHVAINNLYNPMH
ncbi:uncharacterized protein LOC124574490 [Schistocerca americana]|uniref:uncharacterized protein LOC124574490 n=1 Tax=Schistocerca americana TaxID=7009 RepID=UPI001F4F746B|nr:uncharacterized protein LOC124574490 [Schistocerca americana]